MYLCCTIFKYYRQLYEIKNIQTRKSLLTLFVCSKHFFEKITVKYIIKKKIVLIFNTHSKIFVFYAKYLTVLKN